VATGAFIKMYWLLMKMASNGHAAVVSEGPLLALFGHDAMSDLSPFVLQSGRSPR
jgi:hypothetical protein